jgi:trehalose-phosphatase
MKYLFGDWNKIEKFLYSKEKKEKGIFLLMDYDGTLTPIVAKPELAVLSSGMRDLLEKLSKKFIVGIISGRSLADVKNLVRVSGIYYAGNHGFEISGPKLKLKNPEAEKIRPLIQELCKKLEKEVKDINGALVENKGLTFSLHYRLVSKEDFIKLKRIFRAQVRHYISEGKIKVTEGKKVFEIRPNIEWDKGKAVKWLISTLRMADALPIYIGDDKTDEDAFLELKNRGITILVSEKQEKEESNAKYFLNDVGEVKKFLKKLVEL